MSARLTYVPSLDGLRTIAVALVIAFHISVPYLGLGFAGVDVFFVLSGFLITTGLLRDSELHGRPQFAKFWQRRFKRLMPAATLLLLCVLAYATFVMPLFRRTVAAGDVAWTALYLGNWHFMEANSYFNSDGTPSLLLHMWSLAVEEQFYFVWPLVIGAVAWIASRGAKRAEGRIVRFLVPLTIILCVVSAGLLALLYAPDAPDRAYMGTDTKAFEPLLGALVAVLMSREDIRAWVVRHNRPVVVSGAVVAVGVLPLLTGPSAFYFHGGAVILSLAVALLIAGLAASPASLISRGLSVRPMVYLGQISYGLYIWHWPWSVLLDVAHRDDFRMLRAPVALAGTVVCAVLSYHLVEQPIRRGAISKWLTGWRLFVAVLLTMALTLGWSAALRFAPATGNRSVVVVGDSVPLNLMESLAASGEAEDIVVDNAARGGCSPLAIEQQEYLKPDHAKGDCRPIVELQEERLNATKPDVVFWWSRYEINQRWVDGRIVGPASEEFWHEQEKDLRAAVDRLTNTGATLVIGQTERPGIGMRTRCSEDDCHPLLKLMVEEDKYRRRWNQMVVDLSAEDPRVRTFRLDPLLCNDPEPAQVEAVTMCDDTQPDAGYLRPDGSHIDVEAYGAQKAEEVLQAVLEAAS